jgi:hypothetical protein
MLNESWPAYGQVLSGQVLAQAQAGLGGGRTSKMQS